MPTQVRTQESIKARAACDECRIRKLKCSGDRPSCARCLRESICCNYSPQKPMGRPKKRQRPDDGVGLTSSTSCMLSQDQRDFDAMVTNVDEYAVGWNSDEAAMTDNTLAAASHDIIEDAVALPDVLPDGEEPIASMPQSPLPSGPSTAYMPAPASHNVMAATEPSCACLSTMYLTLDSLHSMDPNLPFPFALHVLRQALQATSAIIACEQCPKRCITMVQNTQSVGTLLVSLAERFSSMLRGIDKETRRAEAANETKRFRLTDLNLPGFESHLGGPECMAAFNIDMSPCEWRNVAKKVVHAEACGPDDGSRPCQSLLTCIKAMEARQALYHTGAVPRPPDLPWDRSGSEIVGPQTDHPDDYMCLKMALFAKDILCRLSWD